MTAIIMDGRAFALKERSLLAKEIEAFKKKSGIQLGLAVILVGNDPASSLYVNNKRQACNEVGIESSFHSLPENISQNALIDLINEMNQNNNIHGILVQLPLPSHIDTQLILQTVSPQKDVDGFHPQNLGLLAQGNPYLRPCTPMGVMELLHHYQINLKGLNTVVVGCSIVVGLPMVLELLAANATVTVCHRETKDLDVKVKQAELLVSATGTPHLIEGKWIKPGAVIIDVGITRLNNGKIIGDVEFDVAKDRAGWITPVPGGIGPMTVTMLLRNTLLAARGIVPELEVKADWLSGKS